MNELEFQILQEVKNINWVGVGKRMEEGKDGGGGGTQHRKHMNFVFKGPPSYTQFCYTVDLE